MATIRIVTYVECILCLGEIKEKDLGNATEIVADDPSETSYVCASCAKAEPGLMAHIAGVKYE